MATGGGDKSDGGEPAAGGVDLYAVLGLRKECSDADLKVAYRKLAMVRNWLHGFLPPVHPFLRIFICIYDVPMFSIRLGGIGVRPWRMDCILAPA